VGQGGGGGGREHPGRQILKRAAVGHVGMTTPDGGTPPGGGPIFDANRKPSRNCVGKKKKKKKTKKKTKKQPYPLRPETRALGKPKNATDVTNDQKRRDDAGNRKIPESTRLERKKGKTGNSK